MARNNEDTFGSYYDPTRKTRQVYRLEKMEQIAQSQAGSNSASFFLYRRAKFIEKDREEKMREEENERQKKIEAAQVAAKNKLEVDKHLKKNQLKRLKKKMRQENYEKRLRGELPEPTKKKMVRDESAVKAVTSSIQSRNTQEEEEEKEHEE